MDWLQRAVNTWNDGGRNPGIDPSRVPPHQIVTSKFPVMTVGATPSVPTDDWGMRLFGLVEEEVEVDWRRLLELPQTATTRDFHCVTQWSKMDVDWAGVRLADALSLCRPTPEATHAMIYGYDGYTTNLDLPALMADDVLLAHSQDGQPLAREHGGPVRLVVPSVYGWKSAKWVRGIELLPADAPGFWEQRGYHMRGDYWKEERFG